MLAPLTTHKKTPPPQIQKQTDHHKTHHHHHDDQNNNSVLQILVNLPDVRARLMEFAGAHQVGGWAGGRVMVRWTD